jgi:hypothetical protein
MNRPGSRPAIVIMTWMLVMLASCEQPSEPQPGAKQIRGITLVDWTAHGYSTMSAREAVERIAATGASHLVILVTAYQSSPSSSLILHDSLRTPSLDDVRSLLLTARSLGLDVTIKPHVDLTDNSWRAHIRPDDPRAWFDSYQAFIFPLAALADSLQASIFMVGCELAGTLQHEHLWQETIARLRSRFRGRLTYAASWDEAMLVPFWEDLDAVGIDCYMPIATRNNPTPLELLAGWAPVLHRLELLHRQAGRPILLTEIGYRSMDGAGCHPYSWGSQGSVDVDEQAALYTAALQATTQDWI